MLDLTESEIVSILRPALMSLVNSSLLVNVQKQKYGDITNEGVWLVVATTTTTETVTSGTTIATTTTNQNES